MNATSNVNINVQDPTKIKQPVLQQTTVTELFEGTFADIKNGGLVPSTSTGSFAGVLLDYAKVEAGSAEAVSETFCEVDKFRTYEVDAQGITPADLQKEVACLDNQTVVLADETNTNKCGRIVKIISPTRVKISIAGYAK